MWILGFRSEENVYDSSQMMNEIKQESRWDRDKAIIYDLEELLWAQLDQIQELDREQEAVQNRYEKEIGSGNYDKIGK